MKIKKFIFILVLLGLFAGCYRYMEAKFDPLARYPYATDENREVILNYMSEEDIDYIVSQKIRPEQFMDFIRIPGFEARNTLYYDAARRLQPTDLNSIVLFVNQRRANFANFTQYEEMINNYSYTDLTTFFAGEYSYLKGDVKLVANPSKENLVLAEKSIVYKYVPKNLVDIENAVIPNASKDGEGSIRLQEPVYAPLAQMLQTLGATNSEPNGGLILTSGFISYEKQVELYGEALLKHGAKDVQKYVSLPGCGDQQLGTTMSFSIANIEVDALHESAQVKWINENAHKFGFIVRYPRDKEAQTGKLYQPLTLRYVGKKVALEVFESKKTLDEIIVKE